MDNNREDDKILAAYDMFVWLGVAMVFLFVVRIMEMVT